VEVISLIKIDYLDNVELPMNVSNAVFTSKNAVRGWDQNTSSKDLNFGKVFCVGKKTKASLNKRGVEVNVVADSSEALAKEIVAQKINEVYFFCGNLRRDDLPNILHTHNISVTEVQVYNTTLIPSEVNGTFEGVLFFSPSAIKSYNLKNNDTHGVAFCIGNTTASEAKKHFKHVKVAKESSIQGVIECVQEYFDYE